MDTDSFLAATLAPLERTEAPRDNGQVKEANEENLIFLSRLAARCSLVLWLFPIMPYQPTQVYTQHQVVLSRWGKHIQTLRRL